jgi:DNA polymerase-3 subunit delta'
MHPWNTPLLESLKRRFGHLPHALLLHGARGVGKLALAERIVQTLLCEASDEAKKPCGVCEGCRWYAAGNHPDLRRLEPEALARQPVEPAEDEAEPAPKRGKPSMDIKIEQVRALADFLNVGSHRGRSRVALVHPAEEMNVHAANSLLKGLEEPPAGAMFILVSHQPARLLPTIRSRCVAIPVPLPPKAAALKWLEDQGVKQAERWLAFAGGAPLRALQYSESSAALERLLQSLAGGGCGAAPPAIDDRAELEAFAECLQKVALDRAFSAFGLTPKYGTESRAVPASARRAWLAFARQMGPDRALARHPLNARLFAGALLAGMPRQRS